MGYAEPALLAKGCLTKTVGSSCCIGNGEYGVYPKQLPFLLHLLITDVLFNKIISFIKSIFPRKRHSFRNLYWRTGVLTKTGFNEWTEGRIVGVRLTTDCSLGRTQYQLTGGLTVFADTLGDYGVGLKWWLWSRWFPIETMRVLENIDILFWI